MVFKSMGSENIMKTKTWRRIVVTWGTGSGWKIKNVIPHKSMGDGENPYYEIHNMQAVSTLPREDGRRYAIFTCYISKTYAESHASVENRIKYSSGAHTYLIANAIEPLRSPTRLIHLSSSASDSTFQICVQIKKPFCTAVADFMVELSQALGIVPGYTGLWTMNIQPTEMFPYFGGYITFTDRFKLDRNIDFVPKIEIPTLCKPLKGGGYLDPHPE